MMNPDFQAGMAEATRLTQAGRLAEAASLIQRLLNGGPVAAGAEPAPTHAGPLIDLEPVSVSYGDAHTADPAPPPRPKARTPRGMPAGLSGNLADTLNQALGKGWTMPGKHGRTVPVPEGARFEELVFSNEAGSRSYKLYVPAKKPEGPLPLVLMLHGCTQSPDDFAIGTGMNKVAEEHGFLVAYPAQPQSANAQKCWNWFNPADQQRDGGEPSILAGIVKHLVREHGADPARVYVAGLSAGGAAAAVMGAAYPDLFAAVGVHSGLACGSARDIPSAFQAMRQGAKGKRAKGVPTIVFHGDRDSTVHPSNADAVLAQAGASAKGLASASEQGRSPAGQPFTRTLYRDGKGRVVHEHWTLHGAGHAWAGGDPAGSYTDKSGPDASRAMAAFFLSHRHKA